jgi:hypothetical protein
MLIIGVRRYRERIVSAPARYWHCENSHNLFRIAIVIYENEMFPWVLGFALRAPQGNVPQPNLRIKIFLIGDPI